MTYTMVIKLGSLILEPDSKLMPRKILNYNSNYSDCNTIGQGRVVIQLLIVNNSFIVHFKFCTNVILKH